MRRHLSGCCAAAGWAYALGMVLCVNAAQNPCTKSWQWQWAMTPDLGIVGPTGLPDQCVGPLSVGPAQPLHLPGIKWEVDINNCPEPPSTRNDTIVHAAPSYSWSLYSCPAGTTPLSGSGDTALFTTTRGGSVVVQFMASATIPAPPHPPYSQSVAFRTSPFRVFEVTSLLPDQGCEVDDLDGNPHTKVFVVPTGSGVVTVTASPIPSVVSQTELPTCWTLAGGTGTSRLVRTVPKNVAQETTITCNAGTSYKTTRVIPFYFSEMHYKWQQDPGYLSTDGCGRVHASEPFSFRAQVVPVTVPLQWEFWKTSGANTLLATGFGREFTRVMPSPTLATGIRVRFYTDCNGNLQYDPGEYHLTRDFNNKSQTSWYVTMSRHVAINNYTADDFWQRLYDSTQAARRRDRWLSTGGDVHCRTWLGRKNHPDGSPYKVFGQLGDGLNHIHLGNYQQALAHPGDFMIVDTITVGPYEAWGWAPSGTTRAFVVSDAHFTTYVHEYIHVRGRDGHDNNSPFHIMSNQWDPTIRDSLAPYDAGFLE